MLMWDRGKEFENEMGHFELGERNGEGEELLRICQENNLNIVNTLFKKRREHRITYKSGDVESQIDYVMLRQSQCIKAKECKVIPGEECLTQHRLLCCDFKIKYMIMPKIQKGEKEIKMWKLKNEQRGKQFEERLQENITGATVGWTGLSNAVMETAREVCGKSRGQRHWERKTWWWCEEVQQAIIEKRDAYKRWQRERTEGNKGRYKEKSRLAKRAVAVAKGRAWTEWCQNIDTAEGKQKMFKMAKQMKEERKDVSGVRYVKDEHGNIKVEEADINTKMEEIL